jgi:hypothetical protein
MKKMTKFETEWKLVPLISGSYTGRFKLREKGDPYYEQILLYEGEYPFAVIHMDTFYHSIQDNHIHDLLNQGKQLKVKVTFEVINEDNPTDPTRTTQE